jgi:hypothetical protein
MSSDRLQDLGMPKTAQADLQSKRQYLVDKEPR